MKAHSDPLIAAYKAGVDRTLIRENLRKTHEERLLQLQRMQAFVAEVRAAGEQMRRELEGLGKLAAVKEVRQCGFIAGIEPRESPRTDKNVAAEVCLGARRYGLLTRPIRNVVVLMPPLCISSAELSRAIEAIRASILEVCGAASA